MTPDAAFPEMEALLAPAEPTAFFREQWEREMRECLEVFTGLWNERVNSPEARNDLVSMMAHHDNTRNMTPTEYFGNLILLIVGGNDTTRNSMTHGSSSSNGPVVARNGLGRSTSGRFRWRVSRSD